MIHRFFLGLALLVVAMAPAMAGERPDKVLEGDITGTEHQSYRLVPFDVPAGTERITVEFDYSGRDRKTTIDLGLVGPDGFRGRDGFRGWSGGNKRRFTVAATDATPSYQPGPITPGRWSLLLGFPNIRPASRDTYSARIWFDRDEPDVAPLRHEAGWYRGDLHMHDAHSDGSCASQGGQRVPCPLFLSVQKAAERGLDFIAVTDHNTMSQANGLRELQPYFDRVLLIPGREVTTFAGHGNLIGPTAPVDFRVGTGDVPDWNRFLTSVEPLGGIFSINHPIRPSGEICMGCGWAADQSTDYARVQAVEAVNGGDADTPYSGIPFWEKLLDEGHRITAIGGSDNHDAKLQGVTPGGAEIGRPTTVVHAETLSMPAILAGIRAGRVFVDVQGTRERALDFVASAAGRKTEMGGVLEAPMGSEVAFDIRLEGVPGGKLQIVQDGHVVRESDLGSESSQSMTFTLRRDGIMRWMRIDVRGSDGKLWLLGNPIYFGKAVVD